MALIKCPECGKKFSEHAEFCPNCGYKWSKEHYETLKKDEHTLETSKLNGDNSKTILSIIGFVVLLTGIGLSIWILYFIFRVAFDKWLVFPLWKFLTEAGILILGLILIFLGGIFISKKKPSWKKYSLYLMSGILILTIIGQILDLTIHPTEAERAADEAESKAFYAAQEEKIKQNYEKIVRENSSALAYYYGTWEYRQPNNHDGIQSLQINIKEDNTATAKIKADKEYVFYGSWSKHSSNINTKYGNAIRIDFDFNDTEKYVSELHYIDYLRLFTSYNNYIGIKNGVMIEDYIYEDYADAKAKNPNKRVKVVKIN